MGGIRIRLIMIETLLEKEGVRKKLHTMDVCVCQEEEEGHHTTSPHWSESRQLASKCEDVVNAPNVPTKTNLG